MRRSATKRSTSDERARLEAQRRTINARLNTIQEEETRDALRLLVGRYFKYPKNCFSCPEKPSDYWPIYRRVVLNEGGNPISFEFQTDKYGRVETKTEELFHGSSPEWVEIKGEEFYAAFAAVQAHMTTLATRTPLPKGTGEEWRRD